MVDGWAGGWKGAVFGGNKDTKVMPEKVSEITRLYYGEVTGSAVPSIHPSTPLFPTLHTTYPPDAAGGRYRRFGGRIVGWGNGRPDSGPGQSK